MPQATVMQTRNKQNTVLSTGKSSSGQYNSNAGGFVRATTPYSNGSYTKPNSTSVSKSVGDEYVRNPTRTTASSNGNVPQTPSYTGSSGGYGGGGGDYSAMLGSNSMTDDILNKIRSLLEEQKARADEAIESQYKQQLEKYEQDAYNDRRSANSNYMRSARYLNSLYGQTGYQGAGLSNMARNTQNWQSNLASIRQNLSNNSATALTQRNSGLANNASTLAQGWYNYILPIYTNRQQNLDDLDYRYKVAQL